MPGRQDQNEHIFLRPDRPNLVCVDSHLEWVCIFASVTSARVIIFNKNIYFKCL